MIKKVCVIGSGVMGLGIASLMASLDIEVLLLDVPSSSTDKTQKNLNISKAVTNEASKANSSFTHPSKIYFIEIGNLEDDLNKISNCDLIIEVIIEKLEIKQDLYNRISKYLKPEAILASNTTFLPYAL